jgi:Ni2+-binding GTPase involved in maturation of urease and hydrogenase
VKLFLLSGFLGSGKTTAIAHACGLLKEKTKVAVITNDQGAQLVDTLFIQSLQVPLREVVNGCFCCRYKDLDAGIRSLSREEEPEIVFAESVGSCTDLIATVVNPLMQAHPSLEIVVSVFADACLLHRFLVKGETHFKSEVEYIFRKQLNEADLLVVNKIDLIQSHELQVLKDHLLQHFPHKLLLFQNSLDSTSISYWISAMQQFQLKEKRKVLEINYDTYAEGEAKLGWLDEELEILTAGGTAMDAASSLVNKIYGSINQAGYLIGHLKFLLSDGVHRRKISFVTLHQNAGACLPFLSNACRCIVIVNARVQANPDVLKCLMAAAIRQLKEERDCKIIERKLLAFRPGYPKPLHRVVHS